MIEVISRSDKNLKKLEFPYKETVKDKSAASYADDIGKLPYIVLNGVTIETKDVSSFTLYNDRYLPEVEMTFIDPTNKLWDSSYPLDQQILSIMIKSNEELLMPIRMDFFVNNFTSVKSKSGDSDLKEYELLAKLDVPYFIKNNSFKGNSYDVLKKIAKETELGFASNIETTNDEMTWLNSGIDYVREMIPDIVKHSYINDSTFLWAYIDFWYNLNYVDIEKQMNVSTVDDKALTGNSKISGSEDVIPLKLSNHPDNSSTDQYFDKFNLVNDSTEVNYDLGYNPHIYWYQLKEKNINNVLLDTISDKGNSSDKIVMKGQPDNNNYSNNQQKNYFLGEIDIDNVHKNYLYSEKSNEHNLEFLQKIRMKVILKKANFQLYRFQMINLLIYKLQELDSSPNVVTKNDIEKGKDQDKYKLNERLSGDWLIIGINYTYTKKSGEQFLQEITLVKRELSAAKIAKNE